MQAREISAFQDLKAEGIPGVWKSQRFCEDLTKALPRRDTDPFSAKKSAKLISIQTD